MPRAYTLLGCGGAYHIAIDIECVKEAEFIEMGVRLKSPQRILLPMKNDASIALSYPQNRTARRVRSYERLWFGNSIMWLGPISLGNATPCSRMDWARSARTVRWPRL